MHDYPKNKYEYINMWKSIAYEWGSSTKNLRLKKKKKHDEKPETPSVIFEDRSPASGT